MISGIGTVLLIVAYAITLAAGLLTLPSPQVPIGDPYFPILEILIILMTPVMVALMVAVHAWSPPDSKTFSLMALVFMVLMAGLTCSLHFVILTLLALGGLTGVITGDMQLRNIGIAGYVGVFPVAAALLALLFHRAAPYEPLQPLKSPTH
jgi:hypothetical protein